MSMRRGALCSCLGFEATVEALLGGGARGGKGADLGLWVGTLRPLLPLSVGLMVSAL